MIVEPPTWLWDLAKMSIDTNGRGSSTRPGVRGSANSSGMSLASSKSGPSGHYLRGLSMRLPTNLNYPIIAIADLHGQLGELRRLVERLERLS